LFLSCNLWAVTQEASLLGVVRDESGAVIAGAKVTLIRLATGEKMQRSTNASGNYEFSRIQDGSYVLRAQQANFETQERRVVVGPGEDLHLDFALRVFKITESVDVTDMVNVLCTVTDKRGRLVTDLTQRDFLIKEDGKRQRVASFLRETTLPLTVAILVDSSLSVQPILEIEKQTAKEFLRAVLREQDVAIVVNFDRNLSVHTDFSADTTTLAKDIDSIVLGKGTSLHDAVLSTCQRLMTQGGRKVIVLISDGEDTTSQARFRDAIEFTRRAGAVVYAISNRVDTSTGGDDQTLRKYAQETGGRAFFSSQASGIRHAFSAIQEELRRQYSVSYESTNTAQDGSFRRVAVTLPSHPDLKVRSNKGYFAAKSVPLSRQ